MATTAPKIKSNGAIDAEKSPIYLAWPNIAKNHLGGPNFHRLVPLTFEAFPGENWDNLTPKRHLYNFIIGHLRNLYTKQEDDWTTWGWTTDNLLHPVLVDPAKTKLTLDHNLVTFH